MDFTQFFKYYMSLILWIIRNSLLTGIWKIHKTISCKRPLSHRL
nr:MAG TPA: hypothetical protein [Bacteriophage sp.]DAZ37884.1 MAG TPA: hypothetical protein [Caudoviricetes sp.]